jgi:hypothetical protein
LSCVWPIIRKPNLTFSNTSFIVNNNRNGNKCWFLLSFTQLSFWSNKFFDRGFTPIVWSGVHNYICNTISLAKDVRRMSSVGGAQTIISILKLEPPPMFTKAATRTQLWNWDHLTIIHWNIVHIFHLCVHVLSYL